MRTFITETLDFDIVQMFVIKRLIKENVKKRTKDYV